MSEGNGVARTHVGTEDAERSQARLEIELERIEKRLQRDQKKTEEYNAKIANSRVRKAESHLHFLQTQTEVGISQTITSLEGQKVQLYEQLAALDRRIQWYVTFLEDRATLIRKAEQDLEAARMFRDGVSPQDAIDKLNEFAAFFQKQGLNVQDLERVAK